eukprot:Platyproteum_vivax@DN2669_c0_g1_i1.p1
MDIGKKCFLAECNKVDFLPFLCTKCCQYFCEDHLKHATCEEAVPSVVVCRKCRRFFDTEQAAADHMQSCTAQPQVVNCKLKGCEAASTRFLLFCVCEKCGHTYCLKHRSVWDHLCRSLEEEEEEQASQKDKKPKVRSLAAKSKTPEVLKESKPTSQLTEKQMQQKLKVQRIKVKMNSEGLSSIPAADRIQLYVYTKVFSSVKNRHMWIDGSKALGWTVDYVCKTLQIANQNNVAGAPQVYLKKLIQFVDVTKLRDGSYKENEDDWCTLDSSVVASNQLEGGDCVWLDIEA